MAPIETMISSAETEIDIEKSLQPPAISPHLGLSAKRNNLMFVSID